MRILALLALALAAPLAHAQPAADADRSADIARTAADTAEERLVDLRRAIWSRLDQAQRAAFAERERTWLNAGRAEEQKQCQGLAPTPLVVQQCRLLVAERRLSVLAPDLRASITR
jgi:hypothetical protein